MEKCDSFSIIHALAYSFIGFQTAYIATQWNPIYWDTACLVVNSGSLEDNSKEELVDIYYPEAQELQEGTTFQDLPDRSGKIKKTASTDYTKVAKALGEIIDDGIKISLIDINKSDFGFKPDVENNQILFGMKALNGVGEPIIEKIKANRPYVSFKDFLKRCSINKTAMISLIKGGAFDELEKEAAAALNVEPRIFIMTYYLTKTSEPKTKLNLQNFSSLVNHELIPQELNFEKQVYYFNKYLKGHTWKTCYFMPDQHSMNFYADNFNMDNINIVNNCFTIEQKTWDKIYQQTMDAVRVWLQNEQKETLDKLNLALFKEEWQKYATGNVSAWEMASLCFYYHQHELITVDNKKYGIVDFKTLNPVSAIDSFFRRNGKQIPIYKLSRIAGTVIGKNDIRHMISLLTTTGVVNVKFTRDHYAMYNKQISEVDNTGTKKVKEKGWFTRGTKLLITGYRRDDTFVCKRYKNTPGHSIYKITNVNGKNIELTSNRYGMENNDENM